MFLHDKPESTDIRFGHTIVSDWLAEEISKATPPVRFALTGGLGTGKSTVLKAALEKLKTTDPSIQTAYVDVWKLDKESVRRSAIIKIAKDLRPDDYKGIDEIKESAYGTKTENSKPALFNVHWNLPGILFSAFIGLIIYIVVKETLDLASSGPKATEGIKHGIAILFGLLGVLGKLLEKSIINIQRTVTKAPMVGAEEFEECLTAILSSKKIKKNKTIIVFDNIDRAAPSSSRAILAGISAFFDHSEKETKVIMIVPFDPSCLKDEKNGERPLLDDCEKMFDAIIPLPRLTSEDLTDFAFDQLKKSLSSFSYSEDQFKNLAYLVSFSPFRSPREIKHMVNQLMSKLTLARSLETKSDTRLQSQATLLPNGTITFQPECVLKLLICEKIYPSFTEEIVATGFELGRAFEAETDSPYTKSLDEQTSRKLSEFLHATMGIPKSPPQSASPFLYMKGPDQVISIPSGQALTDALYMGDGEKLRAICFDSEGKQVVSSEDISSVIKFHKKKFSKNTQALKNCSRAFMLAFSERRSLDRSLAIEYSEVLCLIPDSIREVSPAWLSKLTYDHLSLAPVIKLWKLMDAEFISLSKLDAALAPGKLKWASECFVELLKQPDGAKRAGLANYTLPLKLMTTQAVVEALGDKYPENYLAKHDILSAVKLYLSSFEVKLEAAFQKIVEAKFRSIEDQGEIEKDFQEISELWKVKLDEWLNSKDPDFSLEKCIFVSYYWPIKSEKGKPHFENMRNHFSAKVQAIYTKINSGLRVDPIDLGLTFILNKLTSDSNINGVFSTALGSIKSDELKDLSERYSSPLNVWNTLDSNASDGLVQAVDRLDYFDEIAIDGSTLVIRLAQTFKTLNKKQAYLRSLLKTDVRFDIQALLMDFHTHCVGESRADLIDVLAKYFEGYELQTSAMEHFIQHPDDSIDSLLVKIKSFPADQKQHLVTFTMNKLSANNTGWDKNSSDMLSWILLAPEEITDATLKDFIDRIVERGVQTGVDENVRAKSTEVVLQLWNDGHGFSEKTFKILKRAALEKFDQKIITIGEKYGVKENIIEKAGNVIDKVLGD